ncbi:hypothetical protein AX14_006338 [Amanita brunnescens Koide BX004]|nr:hypothetical protein AX14_006338 [Amanita brunnescens Koide BX004]
MVMPTMDYIDEIFTTGLLNDQRLDPAIHAAIGLAKKTLNRYYSKTDTSDLYRIAMILHPQHKLEYFKHAKWPESWITTARELLRSAYECSYVDRIIPNADEQAKEKGKAKANGKTSKGKEENVNIFDNLPSLAKPKTSHLCDELENYLGTDIEEVEDPIAWWNECRSVYPQLSRMVLDYLSVPTTSVDVERLFSHSRNLISHTRNRLAAQTARAILCLGDWSLLGMIKNDDLKAVAAMQDIQQSEVMPEGWDDI